jgi:hypothetical protein
MMKILLLASLLLTQQAARPEVGAVSGQILLVDGSAAAGVRVAAMAVEESGVANRAPATLVSLVQTDSQGRYHLENIPPGRYLVTAGFLDSPSYYPGVRTPAEARIITVVAGSVATGIDFTLAQPSGVRVVGRIRNLPTSAPSGLFYANLLPLGPQRVRPLDVVVAPDGTFEFLKVQSGTYTIQLTPQGPQRLQIEVGEKNIDGIELTATPTIFGRVTMEDGSPLPLQQEAVALGMETLFRLRASRPSITGASVATTNVRQDGTFALSVETVGEYTIAADLLPTGYYVKSAIHGTVDLLGSPLSLTESSPTTELRLVLTSARPEGTPAGVKVVGRVTGLERTPAGPRVLVSIQSAQATGNPPVHRAGQAWVNDDGTFEIPDVPRGRYLLRTVPPSIPTSSIVVGGSNVAGIELTLRVLPSR